MTGVVTILLSIKIRSNCCGCNLAVTPWSARRNTIITKNDNNEIIEINSQTDETSSNV